jgi:23S rRNA (uracil1939-C5)-methyltransferase
MQKRSDVPFVIAHLDPLAQGVSKESDKITFIEKTLPGETGIASITASRKGVVFAQLQSLAQASPQRIEPACPHFNQCPSCHYQHASYPDELGFKQSALARLFRKLDPPPIEVVAAPQRLGYRNRIQLHYDLQKKVMGMLDGKTGAILPVSECLIGRPEVMAEMRRLYQDQQWLQEAPAGPQQGHVEIYLSPQGLKISWNQAYAQGGFTQVFDQMNQELRQQLHHWARQVQPQHLLDLFAGDGNLSREISSQQRLCVDVYPHRVPGEQFLSQDLYHKDALQRITRELKARQITPDGLVLDPPRSGMRDLKLWLARIRPQHVAYVSCDPHTLVRDLQGLEGYTLTKLVLLDFFPSTRHFETLVLLARSE